MSSETTARIKECIGYVFSCERSEATKGNIQEHSTMQLTLPP